MNSTEKLQKVLARAGLGSRRELEDVISQGRVQVNGKVATLGDRVGADDKIICDGRLISNADSQQQRLRVILYNKPEGEICSMSDPEGRPTVYEKLPRLHQGRWISVGRLDFNTSGLLLFSNNGDLAQKLMHPSSVIDREYLVRVFGHVDDETIQRLRDGVMLEDGLARFTDITESENDEKNRWFYCTVMEGRNREVRRLWESQNVKVSRLKRVRFGNIFIPSRVRVGQWVELNPKEISELAQTAGYTIPREIAPLTPNEKQDFRRHERKLERPRSAPGSYPRKPSSRKPSSRKPSSRKPSPHKPSPHKPSPHKPRPR